jgi:hypothetical protein
MKRFFQIDFLRASAIFLVFVIHVLAFNLNNKVNYFFWNYLNFVVIAFVFCSVYVLEAGYGKKLNTLRELTAWWQKRLLRLMIPFYIYLFFHYLLWFLFPNFFAGSGLQKSFSFILASIFLYGGVDANWLPLLFVELALVYPLLKIVKKNKKLLIIYLIFSLAVTGFYTFNSVINHSLYKYYRILMIVPYSLIAFLAMELVLRDSFKKYLMIGFLSLLSFLILSVFWPVLGRIKMFDQKYPPNFYYLFYGTFLTMFFIWLSYLKIFQTKVIKKFILFSSTQAYNLFFASYLVNDVVQKQRAFYFLKNRVWEQLFLVIVFTYLLVYFLKRLKSNFH